MKTGDKASLPVTWKTRTTSETAKTLNSHLCSRHRSDYPACPSEFRTKAEARRKAGQGSLFRANSLWTTGTFTSLTKKESSI